MNIVNDKKVCPEICPISTKIYPSNKRHVNFEIKCEAKYLKVLQNISEFLFMFAYKLQGNFNMLDFKKHYISLRKKPKI
jgi:hypothetical protein